MSEASEALEEFHTFFGFPVPGEPRSITGDELALRKTLLEEEHAELQEALDEGDIRHIAKEAADLLYVLYGLDMHMAFDLDRAFRAVHASNMSKVWRCWDCGGEGCDECIDGLRVKYREDGKVLKPLFYEEADLNYLPETP